MRGKYNYDVSSFFALYNLKVVPLFQLVIEGVINFGGNALINQEGSLGV